MARLYEKYKNEVVPQLQEKFGIKNRLAVPRLVKIVVNMGVGRAAQPKERHILEEVSRHLALITGQKPLVTKARKSVSGFRIRRGFPVGLKVTLRGRRMYEFLDRLITLAIPRIRDFRGLDPNAFDGRGNYTFGVSEQLIFPEVDPDDVHYTQGMHITLVTTAKTDDEARELLRLLGMPFRRESARVARAG